ncbi:hypothetical protein [Streptomyces sclerotialus]|uniref:hypothetical protein n=1 Tax=Streptomyces sclerotialus TaxID=1957 RepID=UPI0004C4B1FC
MSTDPKSGASALFALSLLLRGVPEDMPPDERNHDLRRRIGQMVELRGVPLTPAERQRVAECDDPDLLYRWLGRAAFGGGPADVFREEDEDVAGAPVTE